MTKQKKAEYFQYPAGLMDDERVVSICLKMGTNDPFAVLVYLLDTMTRREGFEVVYNDSTKGALAWKFRVSEDALDTIVDHFVDTDILQICDNRLGCDFLKESLTQLLKYREQQAEKGKKGMERRWGKTAENQANSEIEDTNKDNTVITRLQHGYNADITKKRREEKSIKENYLQNSHFVDSKRKNENDENDEKNFPLNAEEGQSLAGEAPQPPSPPSPAKRGADARLAAEGRRAKFRDALRPFEAQYGQQMVSDFFEYWSEMTRSGTQMRYEKQTTWELPRRLATWDKRNINQNQNKHGETRYERDKREREQYNAELQNYFANKLAGQSTDF